METIKIDNDIKILYITATSFPDGVMEAHQQLHALVPDIAVRRSFGLSRPENGGKIVYKAAAEEMLPGEAKKLKCDTMVIKKGNYACIIINNYMNNVTAIGNAFQHLITLPDIDPQGYCVEWYLEKDVKCMVRLNE